MNYYKNYIIIHINKNSKIQIIKNYIFLITINLIYFIIFNYLLFSYKYRNLIYINYQYNYIHLIINHFLLLFF